VVGLGAWQLGADWGEVSDEDAARVLDAALAAGVTFIDTADVYGDGRSERSCGELLARHPDADLVVATKMGRRVAQLAQNYSRENFIAWNERSRRNLGVETIDLVQLHTPPTSVFDDDAVATVQIILNCLRLKPLEQVLPAALAAGVGIIARVPLASGLLSGRYDERTTWAADDHRNYNRHGEAFDVGETFSGVPFEVGLQAVRELAGIVPAGCAMAQFALRWIIDQPGVSVVIPGARNPEQARANAASAGLPGLSAEQLAAVAEVYERLVRPHVHERW
jgi:aryl-alcohol dehydrogenase-like predicted oxidoreductase